MENEQVRRKESNRCKSRGLTKDWNKTRKSERRKERYKKRNKSKKRR